MDKTRWEKASPLLDNLLDVPPATRPTLLAALREEDAALADDLAELLARMEAVEREAFLEGPVTLRGTGMAGQIVGAYTIERELGEGGMGSVWLARRTDGRYEGSVAIKFLHGAGVLPRGSVERFAREGSILARLAHPNIARLIDAGITPASGQRYLVLEYVDGVPIDRYCDSRSLDVAGRVRLFLDVLAAVAHAHNRLILHRDLKPANILVTAAGEVKLLDFGIAKLIEQPSVPAAATELTRAAGRAFTPAFAAPEQVEDGDVTTATDVYALGVLLFALLAGTHPTAPAHASALEQMQSVVRVEPRRLSEAAARQGGEMVRRARLLRGDLDTIVAKALKKAPAERYANAQQLADDLQRYLDDQPIAARPDAPGYVLAKFLRRHRVGVAAGAVAALALTVGAGVALWEAREAQRQRVQAEGLIEFMLGDLRKRLQPVGRLDALDEVGERALRYYAAQDAGQLDVDSLGRRARAVHLIGEIAELRGHLDEAQRVFQEAAASTGELMNRLPGNAQRIFDHAQSVYWVGYVARRRGLMGQAEASFLQYRNLADRLIQLDGSDVAWRMEKAWADLNLGVVHLENSRLAQGLQLLEEARAAWNDIAALRPELKSELANAIGWLATGRAAQGRCDAAIQDQRAKIDLLGSMQGYQQNRDLQRLVANAYYEIGHLHLCLGRHAEGLASAREAVARFDVLAALDHSNLDLLAQSCLARLGLAEIELSAGRPAAALAQVERIRADWPRLVAGEVDPSNRQLVLAGRLLAMSTALAAGQAQPAPIGDLEAYLAVVRSRESTDASLDADQLRSVAAVELALGDALAATGRSTQAQAHWQAVVRRLRAPAERGDLPMMALLAHARLRLGEPRAAALLARQIEATPYRHPAYAELRQRLSRPQGAAAAN